MAAGYKIMFKIFTIFVLLSLANSQKGVIELNEENWTQMLENEWMVEL